MNDNCLRNFMIKSSGCFLYYKKYKIKHLSLLNGTCNLQVLVSLATLVLFSYEFYIVHI